MALDKNATDVDIILADAELTKKVQGLKEKVTEKTALDDPLRAELAAAKAEHREMRREWRELRQWVQAVNAATPVEED